MQIPAGFKPLTWDRLLAHFALTSPILGSTMYTHLDLPEADAKIRIEALEQKGLVQFAVSANGEPAVFTASNIVDIPATPEDIQLMDALVAFWDTTGKFDSELGRIVSASWRNTDTKPTESELLYYVHTPDGGRHSVVARVAHRLHRLGLITQDEQGQYHASSKEQLYKVTAEHGICDFCGDEHPKFIEIVPDFWMAESQQMSEGGWASCETCHGLITENRRTDLLRRALDTSKAGKFTAATLKNMQRQFWEAWDSKVDAAGVGAALVDFIEDRIKPDEEWVNPKLQQKTARIEAIRRLTGLTQDEMDALGKGDVLYKGIARKLSAWRKKFGTDSYEGAKKIAEMLNRAEAAKLPPYLLPHWQIALNEKVNALHKLEKVLRTIRGAVEDGKTLNDDVQITLLDLSLDTQALRTAEVFSFNAETMHAIMVASESIPHEAPLKSIEIPTVRSGWFWFAEPFPVASAPVSSDTTAALLWSWDVDAKKPTIRFSAYVQHRETGEMYPSALWMWPLDQSIHDMLAYNAAKYRHAYGPDGQFAKTDKTMLIGEEATLKVFAAMSVFFMQACQWFRQTVPGTKRKVEPKLTDVPGHIERHARKRYEKEFKTPPAVRVIALRKTAITATEHVETVDKDGKRHLTVRCVVSGHNRLQRCGPGLADTKLIWIDPYVKGPDDAPFKPPSEKVFAVIR